MRLNLDELEQKLYRNVQAVFWVLYVLVRMITGLLAYNWLPNESYDPEVTTLLHPTKLATTKAERERFMMRGKTRRLGGFSG